MLRLIALTIPLIVSAKVVDFKESYELALKSSPAIKASATNIDIAKEDLATVLAQDFGILSLKHNFTYSNSPLNVFGFKLSSREASFGDFGFGEFNGDSSIVPNALNNPSPKANFDTFLEYQYPIFTGFKIEHYKQIASLQIRANEIRLAIDKKVLEKELFYAYNSAVLSRHILDATKKGLESAKSILNLTTEFVNKGLLTNVDLIEAKEHLLKAKSKVTDVQNRYAIALAYIRFLTVDSTIDGVYEFEIPSIETQNLNILQELAIANRDEIKFISSNLATLSKKIDVEKSENYPQVGLFARYGLNSDSLPTLQNDYYTVGVGINYTIFDAGSRVSKSEKANLEHLKVGFQKEELINSIKLDVEKSLLDMETKKEIVSQKEQSKLLAEEIFENSLLMYKNSLITISDLLIKEARVFEARANLYEAEYNYLLSIANLKYSIGAKIKE